MSDPLPDLNLILTPDWLKEPADKNPYANYQGEPPARGYRGDRPRRGGPRPDSRGGGQGGPEGRQNRGPRPDQRGGPRPQRAEGGRPTGAPRGAHQGQQNKQGFQGKGRGQQREGGRPRSAQERVENREAAAPQAPAVPLQVDFIAEVEGIAALTKQIKGGPRAYPLYSLGRMFLNKPERHRVKITTLAPACPIFRIGEDGPISLNRQQAERDSFRVLRNTYYSEETQQIDAPKGNFTNVARCRISGVLLGPTNYHGYQPALRRLYDARFSRRSSFEQFLRQIEVVNDAAVVEQWKTESSSVTVFRTLKEEEPQEFKTLQEVEAHFRAHYLEKEVLALQSVEVGGVASRNLNDRTLREAIRAAWEKERGFPAQLANQLRPHFSEAGLQIWKHRKRVLFVSTSRPSRFTGEGSSVSESVTAILGAIEAAPRATRADLLAKLHQPSEDEAEVQKAKAALAADLHWLISSGHVIEFHDATLDLPLPPKEATQKEAPSAEPAAVEASPEAETEEAEVVEAATADVPDASGDVASEVEEEEEAAPVAAEAEVAAEAVEVIEDEPVSELVTEAASVSVESSDPPEAAPAAEVDGENPQAS